MPISADQWRAVVGSNSVRRPRQVVSIEQLLLNKLTKTLSQQNGGDTTLGTPEGATLDATGGLIQTGPSKADSQSTPSDVEAAAVMVQVMISAVCVQVLQSFVSMVTLSLLILSGDVETNPGPTGKDTPEYRTIVACTVRLTTAIAQGVSQMRDCLFEKCLIAEQTRDQLFLQTITTREKASILIRAIQYSVESNSDNFHTFIDVLKQEAWLEPLVKEVEEEYKRVKAGLVPHTIPTVPPVSTSASGDIPRGKPTTPAIALTTSQVNALREAIWEVRVKWNDIGSCLRVPQASLDEIKHDYHSFRDDGQRLKQVLLLWIGSGKATIHTLLEALRSKIVHHVDIANQICARRGEQRTELGMCTTRCEVCNPNCPDVPVTAQIAQTTSQKLNFTTLLRNEGLTEEELKKRLDGNNIFDLARLFDDANFYVDKLQLSPGDKTDVHRKAVNYGTHLAMKHALECWKSRNPLIATFKELLLIVLDLEKGEIAINICDYYKRKYKPSAAAKQPVYPTYPDPTHNEGAHDTRLKKHVNIAEKGYQKQTNNSGNFLRSSSTDESSPVPHHVYCGQSQVEDPKGTVPAGTAAGQCDPKKLWPITSGKDVLKVYFMNENALASLGLNTQNIMDAARMWNHYDPSGDLEVLKDLIPKFVHTRDKMKSDIRVKIEPNGRSWSKVGIAAIPVDKSQPTMTLGLIPGNVSYNRHIVIHEFGHALGLEHEHQRSKFWSVAEKFLDINKMKQDNDLSNTDVDGDYLQKCPPGGSAEYDPESIMHYWFRKEWLKDQYMLYQNVANVVTATEAELSPVEKKVLLGIHSRDESLADKPSNTDYEYLAREYYYKKRGVYLSIPSSIGAGSGSVPPPGGPATVGSQAPVNSTDDTNVPIGLLIDFNDEGQSSESAQPGGGQSSESQEATDSTNSESVEERDSAGVSVQPLLPQLLDKISDIAKRMNKPCTIKQALDSNITKIGVIGPNNTGKSTTLNALLGGRFLPASSGRTTAHVLCIKHDPDKPNGELYDMTEGETKLASGKKDIYDELEKLNEERHSDMSQKKLELRVHIPFLADCNTPNNQFAVELYDTPGACEDKDSQISKDAKQTVEEMDGLILVLSQDTVDLESTVILLQRLRQRFPLFLSEGKPSRGIVLVNKSDKFHDDHNEEDDDERHKTKVAKKCERISKRVGIPREKMVFCSAKLGLSARKLRASTATEWSANHKQKNKEFYSVLHDTSKFPEKRESVEDLEQRVRENLPIQEAAKELADITESASNIKEVERRICGSCPLFKRVKAVDDALYQVGELTDVAKKEEKYAICGDLAEVKRKLESIPLMQ